MLQISSRSRVPAGILGRDINLLLISMHILATTDSIECCKFWNFLMFLSIQTWHRVIVKDNLTIVVLNPFPLKVESWESRLEKVCGCQMRWDLRDTESQTCLVNGQLKKRWSWSSSSEQKLQHEESMTPNWTSLSPVDSLFWMAIQLIRLHLGIWEGNQTMWLQSTLGRCVLSWSQSDTKVFNRKRAFLKPKSFKDGSLDCGWDSREKNVTFTWTRRQSRKSLKFNKSFLNALNRTQLPFAEDHKIICKAEIDDLSLFTPPMKVKIWIGRLISK